MKREQHKEERPVRLKIKVMCCGGQSRSSEESLVKREERRALVTQVICLTTKQIWDD